MSEPFHIMTKPSGSACNLDCTYCFYLEKEKLYEHSRLRMADDVLETYIRQHIASQEGPEASFAWQGGEPTLLGVGFFRRAVELQGRYANGKRITNALQTNGTLLDDEWGEFLAEHGFLVGLSVDGPRELHDAYRVDKRQRPTFDAVMRGLSVLKAHHVEFNTLTVVSRANAGKPEQVYAFLKEIGSRYLQFIPLVERSAQAGDRALLTLARPPHDEQERLAVTPWSVGASRFGEFMIAIFDKWVRSDVGRIFVQLFDVSLGNWMGAGPGLCVFSETCGRALAMEHNGDVYSCDHYVYPEYKLGNVVDTPLEMLVDSDRQRKFGSDKRETLTRDCLDCEVRFACNGDCPKHRFRRAQSGEWGLSYLCPSYRAFFNHIDPYMRAMAGLLRAGRAPAEIMSAIAQSERPATTAPSPRRVVGRNDPCPCGSGRKYKACCMRTGGARSDIER